MITARHPATQHKRPAFLPNYIQSIFSVTYRPGRVDDEVDGVVNSLHKVRFLKSSNCPFDLDLVIIYPRCILPVHSCSSLLQAY